MAVNIEWVDECAGAIEAFKLNTPAGSLLLHCRGGVICDADWACEHSEAPDYAGYSYLQSCQADVTVKLLKQGSPYRHKVWAALCKIPVGATLTYSAVAKNINSSARAVGNACRDNPYPLIIPCHRVVSVSGMGGYCGHTTGDFMRIKQQLLDFEARF